VRRRAFVAGALPLAGCAGAWRRWAPEVERRPGAAAPGFVAEELPGGGSLISAAVEAETVHLGVSLAVGAEADPPAGAGLTALALASLADRRLRDLLGGLGAAPRSEWSGDGGALVCTVAAEDAAEAATLVAQQVRGQVVDATSFAAALARARARAAIAAADPRTVATRALDAAVFPAGHPYVHRGVMRPDGLVGVTHAAVAEHMARHLVPGRLAALASARAPGLAGAIAAAWDGWAPEVAAAPEVAWPSVTRRAIKLIDWPGAEQAVLAVGRVGVAQADAALATRAMRVLRSVVHERLRGDRGLVYYVDAGHDEGRLGGRLRLITQVEAGAVGAALKVVRWSLEHVQELAVSQVWMSDQDAYDGLTEVFVRDDGGARIEEAARRHRLGWPLDDVGVKRRPVAQLLAAIDVLMRPADWQVVCVGDRGRVLAQLERFGAVEVG
jgi:hypothetical protein